MVVKRPTQNDVARLANVSRGTVSRVLNDQKDGQIPISDETRDRVMEAAQTLGYAPNPVAQMLARGHNRLIGIFSYEPIFPYSDDDFFFPYLSGIQAEAGHQGYNILLFTAAQAEGYQKIYRQGMNSLHLADGSILLGTDPDRDELRQLTAEGYPFVFIGRREVEGAQINWVVNDYAAASQEATAYLLELGHTSIGFLAGGTNAEPQYDKRHGIEVALAGTGLDMVTLPDIEDLTAAELASLIESQGVTALLCSDQNATRLALDAAVAGNLHVPDQLSVISLTNCGMYQPLAVQPTFFNMNRPEVGRMAIRHIISLLNGQADRPLHGLAPCELVIKDTTGRPIR